MQSSVVMPLAVLVALALLATPAAAETSVQLQPVAGSMVSGTANVTDAGVVVQLRGVRPRAIVSVNLHAGTCELPSASFATLASIADRFADDAGNARIVAQNATASGTRANVLLTEAFVADGEHVLNVVEDGTGVVACGAVPRASAAAPVQVPTRLPRTGELDLAAALGLIALALLATGLLLVRAGRRRRTLNACR